MKTKLLLIVTAVTLLFFPKVNFGQAIDLGAAANFVLFTSGGALDDNASAHSHLTGDVGYETSGAFTDFGNVNGVMHAGVDAATTACGLALQSAYTQLDTITPDFAHAVLLGNGETFIPGVYSIPSDATLNLNLFLDAQGDSGAIFIIKIEGTFSTNAGSKVKLINGALACNVFWKIEGLVSMATNSTMRGTIIINNAAINMATGDTLEGRALCLTAGAITVDGITAFTPTGCGSTVLTGPTLPNLGSIACYTIFSGIGALDGSSSSTSIGDVGSNSAASVTGWTPADVTGTLHLIPDGSTALAAIDLSKLYDTLNAMIPDIELLYPAEFGFNLVLTPHVYLMNGATSFTDSIYLDAQGNPNGVFVIKIIGATCDLTTSVNSRVKLINGAQAKNVFWMVKGAVNINANSIFRGTIVVPAGAINLVPTGVILDGRALTMVGAITTAGLAATMPPSLSITTQPANQTACAGDSVSFSVTATGANLTYQWRKGTLDLTDGVNISGADSATLTFNPVYISDTASDYNVLITGSCSPNDSSINVSLVVDTALIIITQPVNQTVCAGDSVSFLVTATGTNITYQWRKGNVNITGATSDTLTINPVSISDTASNYNVVITGTCSSNDTSINVSLEVNTAPIIITEPANQTVCAGDSVSFVVVATGSGLTYQWRKDTVNLINGGNISGADSDTLTINPAALSDIASNYNVVVSGVCIATDSSSVDLTSAGGFGILAGTAITSTGFSEIHDMDVGLSPGILSSITGFPPAIVVNGAIYASDDIAPPGVAAMLIQAKQDLEDAYLFAEGATAPAPITVAGDQGGKTLTPGIYKSTSTLLIQSGDLTLDAQGDVNAKWIFQIASGFTTIGGAGGNVILTGDAQADNITWQVGSSATIGNGTSFAGNILALTSITMNTGSSIDGRLLARNGAVVLSGTNIINSPSDSISTIVSQSISINVSLEVDTALIIITQPVNQTVCAGDSVSFLVTATGTNLTYQWRKGTLDLTDAGNISGATSDTLTINPASISDTASNYNVVITGTCSSNDTSINVSLAVNTAPNITTEPANQTACEGNSVSFSVVATGTGLTYQWRKGSFNLTNTGNVSGVTSDTLTINPVYLSDTSSIYNVVITGTCLPNDTSINVSLVVDTATNIIAEPVDQTACKGSSVSFSLAATGSGLTYQWRKGTLDLTDTGNISGATSATLTINPVSISDTASNYNVVIIGTCSPSDTSINVSLIVNDCSADLSVVKTVDNTHPIIGHTVVFTITATNNGPADATGVIVTDILQSGYAYVSSTTTEGTYNPSTGVWTIGTLNNGVSEILTVTVIINLTGNYVNTATITGNEVDENSINDVSVVETFPVDLFIPEGFSPNGDGINDLFVIRGILNYPDNTFVIFNRWGNKVFEASPYQNTWGGKSTTGLRVGGDELPIGTYFYILDLGDDSDIIKGTIYLNR